jgi:hypothetical protein
MNQMRKRFFSLIVVAVFLITPVSTVFANSAVDEPVPPTAPTSTPDAEEETPLRDRAVRFLENVYEKSAKLVEHVGTDLERTSTIDERITKAIERQNEMGEDTSEVQTALNTYLAKLPAMESTYGDAVGIYEAHAGFDADGKVTDIDEATDTIQALKDTLVQTHRDWHEATRELRDVLDAYHDAHPKVEEN